VLEFTGQRVRSAGCGGGGAACGRRRRRGAAR
jgi:hypothetical protein